MRGGEKELADIAAKQERVLRCAFGLFADKTIEAVSMTDIANEAGIAIASLYRYFKTKTDLVLAISELTWKQTIREEWDKRYSESMSGAQILEQYLEGIIELYQNNPQLLRFNQYFNIYISHETIAPEKLLPYQKVMEQSKMQLHYAYQRGMKDGTINPAYTEEQMFSTTLHIILAAVTRYAVGLVYKTESFDPMAELHCLKKMILNEFTIAKDQPVI